jgi:hypothetical protein
MKYNKLFLIISATFLSTTFILLSLFTVSSLAQSEEKGINQTKDISKSINQPVQNASQTTANETGEAVPIQKNVTDLGENITEGAKDVVGKIGEGLQDLTK